MRRKAAHFPTPILNLNWSYEDPHEPAPVELAQGDQRLRSART